MGQGGSLEKTAAQAYPAPVTLAIKAFFMLVLAATLAACALGLVHIDGLGL